MIFSTMWIKLNINFCAKVSEEVVLTDATGLHLGAGPYMLVYSRECGAEFLHSAWSEPLRVRFKMA